MTSTTQDTLLIDSIKNLTELDFQSLLEEMADHMRKNKWEHLIDDCFSIETYESELNDLKEEFEDLEREKKDIERRLDRAIEKLDSMMESDENVLLMKILVS